MTHPMPTPEAAMASSTPEAPFFGQSASMRIGRPGARPLVFNGTELAMAMSFTPELPYWYEINVYRTEAQSFVLAIRLFFQSTTLEDRTQAWEFGSLTEVFDALEQYDAAKDVVVSFEEDMSHAPAQLYAHAMELRAKVSAARAHFSGLVGEFFETMDSAAA